MKTQFIKIISQYGIQYTLWKGIIFDADKNKKVMGYFAAKSFKPITDDTVYSSISKKSYEKGLSLRV